MRNAGLEEAQARIKIAGRNINKLRYADDTTLMAQIKEKLMSLLKKVKEESKRTQLKTQCQGFQLNTQKIKIMASGLITSWQIDGETMQTVIDFVFLGSKTTADGDCSTPGLPVPHHLPEFAQVHVLCISDAIQQSHPLTPSSLSTLNLSQHQGLFH